MPFIINRLVWASSCGGGGGGGGGGGLRGSPKAQVFFSPCIMFASIPLVKHVPWPSSESSLRALKPP